MRGSGRCGALMVDPLATGPTNEMRVASEDKSALDCNDRSQSANPPRTAVAAAAAVAVAALALRARLQACPTRYT